MPVLAWVLLLRALVCCRWRCRCWSHSTCGVMPCFTNGFPATCPACQVSSEAGRYWAHPRNQAEKLRAARCSSVVSGLKPTAPRQPTWHEDSQALLNTGFSLPRQWRTSHHSFSQTEKKSEYAESIVRHYLQRNQSFSRVIILLSQGTERKLTRNCTKPFRIHSQQKYFRRPFLRGHPGTDSSDKYH